MESKEARIQGRGGRTFAPPLSPDGFRGCVKPT